MTAKPVNATPDNTVMADPGAIPPERQLWRSVFLQALRDAVAFNGRSIPAAHWLLLDQVNAPTVLEYAGIEAEHVRPRLALLLICRARSIARGVDYSIVRAGTRVKQEKSTQGKRQHAIRFLKHPMAQQIVGLCPFDPHNIESGPYLERAMQAVVAESGE